MTNSGAIATADISDEDFLVIDEKKIEEKLDNIVIEEPQENKNDQD